MPAPPPHRAASAALRDLAVRLREERASLGEILALLGDRGLGMLLIALGVPPLVPSPGLPVGVVFGIVLVLVGVRLILRSEQFSLPGWLARQRVRRTHVEAVVSRAAPLIERIERQLRPRLHGVTGTRMHPVLGVVLVVLGVLIALPIPFGNTLPALAVVLLGLGLIVRDGGAVIAGLAMALVAALVSAAIVGSGVWLADWMFGQASAGAEPVGIAPRSVPEPR